MKGDSRKRKSRINANQLITGLLTGIILKLIDIIIRKLFNL